MDFPQNPFWDFSITGHRKSGVYEACLELQKAYGLDVNLLFFCCWAGAVGSGPLGREKVGAAMAAVGGWQEDVVRPVWQARWRLKPAFGDFPPELTEPLRQALVAAELDAEHIEQLHLAEAVTFGHAAGLPDDQRAEHAAANLAEYLGRFFSGQGRAMPPAGDLAGPLAVILQACFDGLEPSRVKKIILRGLA